MLSYRHFISNTQCAMGEIPDVLRDSLRRFQIMLRELSCTLEGLGNDFCNCCHSFGSLVYAISGQCYLSMLACTPTSVEARNSLSSEILRVGSVSSMRSWYFCASLPGALSFSWKHSMSGPHKDCELFSKQIKVDLKSVAMGVSA